MSFSTKNPGGEVTGDFSKLEALISELGKKYYVDIGILGESNETTEGGLTLAGIGAVHEFGTDRAGRGNKTVIPERSFIRMPLETGQDDIEKAILAKKEKALEPDEEGGAEKKGLNVKTIFKLIGLAGEARIQEAFETGGFGNWEKNSDITIHGSNYPLTKKGKELTQKQIDNEFIKGKGSDSPLIDTGGLRQAIMSKVGGG